MVRLIKELRRREVFRTTGLYIGGAWIVLQVADVVLPVFDTPDWIFKALIAVAVIGLPIAIALAWTYDLTARGIVLEEDVKDEDIALRGRKADFVVIGVLLVALGVSLFINFAPRDSVIPVDVEPVSVLIADFDNQTGDSVFDGALEQFLTIGVEESSFINTFDRATATRILTEIDETAEFDAEGARLVSVREGIDVVVGGTLARDGGGYELSITMVDPSSGEFLADFSDSAGDKTEIMSAIGGLSRELREELGDVDVDSSAEGEETFTTISVEAMHDYALAQRLARDGKDEEAIGLYESAVAKDPHFGRAWTGLAVSALKLGKTDIADEAWPKVLELLEGMTERERYRTAGVYFSVVARNSQKAIENYEMLVEKYPADDAGHNNLAIAYFLDLQFDKALAAGKNVVDLYPGKAMYHANYALFAMYANEFDTATAAAANTLEINPNYHKAYLPYAILALTEGNVEDARTAYENMADTGVRGTSIANTGLADIMLWNGDAAAAASVLEEGMQRDETNANKSGLATKKIMYAYTLWQQGEANDVVSAQIDDALAISSSMSRLVPAALLHVSLGNHDKAKEIAAELGGRLEPQQRAYSKLINALVLRSDGENIAAIEELQEAVALADLWLIRYHLGSAYADVGHYAEAVVEYTNCKERLGEAFSVFLNDTPTFRYTAELDEQLTRARSSMTAQHTD